MTGDATAGTGRRRSIGPGKGFATGPETADRANISARRAGGAGARFATAVESSSDTLDAAVAALDPAYDEPFLPDDEDPFPVDPDPECLEPEVEYGEVLPDDDRDTSQPERTRNAWDALDAPPGWRHGPAPVLVLRPDVHAAGWRVELVAPASTVGVDAPPFRRKAWLQRDKALRAIAQEIVEKQSVYLATMDPLRLKRLPQKEIARAASVDEATVSRALHTTIELPDQHVVDLDFLVNNNAPQLVVARVIAGVFRDCDRLERPGTGEVAGEVVPWADVCDRVRDDPRVRETDFGCSEANLRRVAALYELPSNVRRRLRAYRQGEDWWTRRLPE